MPAPPLGSEPAIVRATGIPPAYDKPPACPQQAEGLCNHAQVNKNDLRKALHLGLGRAILYAQHHDMREFRDVILDACLHCHAYDIQIEGTRASYMHDLVGFLPDKDFYHAEVLKSLAEGGDDWDASQRFHFAACLAFDGNEAARQAMYDHYNPGPRMGDHIGVDFLKLDGIEGLLFAADKLGGRLTTGPDVIEEGWLLSQSLEICGEQATWNALREAGATNPMIERYRLRAEEEHRLRAPQPGQRIAIVPPRYRDLLSDIPMNNAYLYTKWGEIATEGELELAAKGLIAAKNSTEQLAHLRIFARRRFPLDVHPLLSLADVEEDRVGFAAVRALTRVIDPAVRELAFRLVNSRAAWRGGAISLLTENYELGDHRIVLGWFKQEEQDEERHSMGLGLIDFWKRHRDEETEVLMMRSLYENGPCSFCRENAVDRLIELRALPDEFRAECAWDANDDIRDLVKTS
jgi:hypothetical protein